MDWLESPCHFFHPRPDSPFELRVARYDVGLAQRPIVDPPGYVNKPTIRFHLAKPIPPGLFLAIKTGGSSETDQVSAQELEDRPYLDFTNKILIRKVLSIYNDLQDALVRGLPTATVDQVEALRPSHPRPVTLRLVRHGLRLDTIYDVDVVES